MSRQKKHRRWVAFSDEVNAFFDSWHERDKKVSYEGYAPVGEFVNGLVEESEVYKAFRQHGVLPPVKRMRRQ